MNKILQPTAKLTLTPFVLLTIAVACTSFLASELKGTRAGINSEPLTIEELCGKVVLVDFWIYSCVNCIKTFPYLRE